MTKPGIKTTEFWVHAVLQVVAFYEAFAGLLPPTVVAVISASLAAVYMLARAIVKAGAAMGWGELAGEEDPDAATPASEKPEGRDGITVGAALLMGAMLLAGCVMTGCGATETNRVAVSIQATTEQAKLANQLHQVGVTTPAQEKRIAAFLDAQAKAEDAYYAAIRAGDSTALKAAKATWAAATAATKTELAKYTLPAPATQPVNRPGN